VLQRIIHHPCHLQQMEQRIIDCHSTDAFSLACLEVTQMTLDLWRDHPGGSIFGHLSDFNPEQDEDEEDNGDPNTIWVEEYIHFVAETESSLYDSIMENVNAELNEKLYWQEHSLLSVYDQKYSPLADSLDYETRFFKLLDQLCYLLNLIP
jgi:hypothetical protein